MARDTGVAWVGVRRSNHVGPAPGFMPRCRRPHGMIGLQRAAAANANHMATWGRHSTCVLGTNPLAVGVPSGSGPLVLDMATSIVAYGIGSEEICAAWADRARKAGSSSPTPAKPLPIRTAPAWKAFCCRWASTKAQVWR